MFLLKKKMKTKEMKRVNRNDIQLKHPGVLITPNWDWTRYINQQIAPCPVAQPLVEVADPQWSSPLSNSSKLGFVGSVTGVISSYPPTLTMSSDQINHDFDDILTISRQRRLHNMGETWSVSKLLPTSEETEDENSSEISSLTLIADPEAIVPVLDLSHTIGARDFEVTSRLESANPNISFAEALQVKTGRKMVNYEIIWEAIKNRVNDDLELQFESMFCCVDRYLFTYFARNLRRCVGPFVHIPVQNMQMDLLTNIYEWMLADESGISIDHDLISFFLAAKFLGIKPLMNLSWYYFSPDHERGFWEANAFHTYLLAREQKCPDVMILMMSRLRRCFLPVVASSEFLDFEATEVACLLRQDTLGANSEDEVFFACLHWLEFDWSERQKHQVDLLGNIRFAHLSPGLRRSLANYPENEHIGAIGQLPEVVRWLWESTRYWQAIVVSDQKLADLGGHVQQILDMCLQDRVPDRYWVYCPDVPHHHDTRCPRHRELTFGTFKRFLTRLQTLSQDFMDSLKVVPDKNCLNYRCCDDLPGFERTCPKPPIYLEEFIPN
ncbi:uncharacterized protein LOC128265294 [Drosophila gunungcola]|uniref:BACK domain-containing protein n=1 Tax=Drosophila gunungcola TaxID=103775 RepID=A0A9Q0BIE2_9MUSC|nr:uncharacterized protein LOC128265294 [Drosophila gunungcola]KAI8033707.1 hypothetical protein M5D96_013530 [Drosophila gunungcola]